MSETDPEKNRSASRDSEADEQYDSALKPLLWLLVPFLMLILYGVLN